MDKKTKRLKLVANQIRQDIISLLENAHSGHSAGSLGMTDVFTVLYFDVLKHKPKLPYWPGRDRVILSNGHICPVLYATLAKAGYFPPQKLKTFRQIDSQLQGHPHINSIFGVENTSGPLGQGISFACGSALAAKMNKKKYHVYCSMSDGELEEGQPWESFLFACKYKLDNLTIFIDRNHIQIGGKTDKVMPLEPLQLKLEDFGLHVIKINGHHIEEIQKALKKRVKGKPVAIICNTIPGKGVSFMENKAEWHGRAPSTQEALRAIQELKLERSYLK